MRGCGDGDVTPLSPVKQQLLELGRTPRSANLASVGLHSCLDGEQKTEQERDPELPHVLLQHLVMFSPLLFLSGKGFKMQTNKKNILEQVSRQRFLSFGLMKAMSSQ